MTEFLATRPRDWWRSYYNTAVKHAEWGVERPLTLSERKMLVRAIRHRRESDELCSSGVLGMFLGMAIREPKTWMPIYFPDELSPREAGS